MPPDGDRPLDARRIDLAAGRVETRQLDVARRSAARASVVAGEKAIAADKAGNPVAAQQFRAQAAQQRQTANGLLRQTDDLRKKLGELLAPNNEDPCDCGGSTPLLLLPVRLETRFVREDTPARKIKALRVRIFPDAIHNDTLRRALVEGEAAAGAAYWAAAGAAADVAWAELIARVGPRRAAWVAERTRAGAPAPVPEDGDGRVARLLPDRFVVHAFRGNGVVKKVGQPIPEAVALDLFGQDEEALKHLNDIPYSQDDAKWIADFAAAQAIGLAVEIPWSNETVDRLIAVGVRGDSAADTAKAFDRLLESHRYGAGLGFVRPGVPTNNVEEERSGWQPGAPPKPAPGAAPARTNRARLTEVLGIEGRAFAGADGADEQPDADARACNAALWWASWGPFLEMIDVDLPLRPKGSEPAKRAKFRLTDVQRDHIRGLHRDVVRGRGPLPTIRVGAQPYGILPVGLTAAPEWLAAPADKIVLDGVRKARGFWEGPAKAMKPIGSASSNTVITRAFGTAPVSFGLRARQAGAFTGEGEEEAGGAVTTEQELENFLDTLMLEDFWAEGSVDESTTSHAHPSINDDVLITITQFGNLKLSSDSKPIALPYAHDSDPAKLLQIAAGQSAGEAKSVLQALAAIAMAKAKKHQSANSIGLIDTLGVHAGTTARTATTRTTTTRTTSARTTSIATAEVEQMRARGSEALFAGAERARTPAVEAAVYRNYQPIAAGAMSYVELAGAATNPQAKDELSQLGIHSAIWGEGVVTELKEALTRLAQPHLSTADRHILVAEALDLASHRYDAWATALVTRRARALRQTAPTGLHVGAYGWLENIEAGDQGDYGYIHAPGLTHAVTAGILRSGYLAHKQEGAKGAFAIDLTSARVRVAMDLVESRRAGQSLGEALGYRIERGLHEAKLDRFIRNLRRFAWKLAKSGANQPLVAATAEKLAAGSVLDGVKLIDLYRQGSAGIQQIKAAANAAPEDNPYLSGPWVPLQPAKEDGDFVAVLKEASEALDAVADLMIAESVHQLAQGNMARAAAVCDAATTGNASMPQPDVIATPARARTLDHRALLIAGPGPGWGGGASPRALAAPELEAWAAARLGPPERIRLGTGADGKAVTLKGAPICAIDLVYAAASRSRLEALIRQRLNLPAKDVLPFAVERPASGWPAGEIAFGEFAALAEMLSRIVSAARPAVAADFGVPNLPPAPGFTLATATARLDAAIAALKLRLAALKGPAPAASIVAALHEFGIGVAPGEPAPADRQRIVKEVEGRIAAATAARGPTPDAATIAAAGQALFGDGFWILPPIAPPPASDPFAPGKSAATPARLRRWLADMATVRPPLARIADGLLLSEALGATTTLSVVQLAEPEADVVTADFAGDSPPDGIAVVALVERSGTAGQPAVALLLDQFVEPLPDAGQRTSAVAFNAPAPGARPPQACLMATAPDAARWTTDRLMATVAEALLMGKMRGVTFETLAAGELAPRLIPALYAQSWSLQGDDPVANWGQAGGPLATAMRYVKDA